jgi:membrane protease YdiL (CAAX protease family)
LAILLPAWLHLSGAAIASRFAAPASVWAMGLPSNGDQWGILIVAPLGEEVGWRGLLQRRAEKRWGAVRASLWVGVVWALWHVPMFIARPPGALDLAVGVVTILAGAFVFAALFRASGGSVWVAIAAHAGVHCDNTTRVGGPALWVTCAMFVVAAIGCGAWMAREQKG